MKDKIFLDTNILVYLVNEDSPFHENVINTVRDLYVNNELWISRQVLREYAVVMTKDNTLQYPLTTSEVVQDMEKWISMFLIADENVTLHFLELLKKYSIIGKKIHDLNIVATMLAHNIKFLFTFNINDFKEFTEIELLSIKK